MNLHRPLTGKNVIFFLFLYVILLYAGVIVFSIFSGFTAGVYAAATKQDWSTFSKALNPILMAFASLGGLATVSFGIPLYAKKRFNHLMQKTHSAGFGVKIGNLQTNLIASFCGGFVGVCTVILITIEQQMVQSMNAVTPVTPNTAMLQAGGISFVLFSLAVIIAPFIEEFFFRGVLFHGLYHKFGGTIASDYYFCSHAPLRNYNETHSCHTPHRHGSSCFNI
jgi:membrane protease YdiL (CAAX protease family)